MSNARDLGEYEKVEYERRMTAWEVRKQLLFQHYKDHESTKPTNEENSFGVRQSDIPQGSQPSRMQRELSDTMIGYVPCARHASVGSFPPAGDGFPISSSLPGSQSPSFPVPVRPEAQQMGRGSGLLNYNIGRTMGLERGRGTMGPPQLPPVPSIARFQEHLRQQEQLKHQERQNQLHQLQLQQEQWRQKEQPSQENQALQQRMQNGFGGKGDFGLPRTTSFGKPSMAWMDKNEIKALHEREMSELRQSQGRQNPSVSPQKPSTIPRPKHTIHSNPQFANMHRTESNERLQTKNDMHAQCDSRQNHAPPPPSGVPQLEYPTFPGSMGPPPVPTVSYAQQHLYPREQSHAYNLQQANNARPQANHPFDGFRGHNGFPPSGFYSNNQQNHAKFPGGSGMPHAHTFNAGQAIYQQAGGFSRQMPAGYFISQATPTRIPQPLDFAPPHDEYGRHPQFTPGILAVPQGFHPRNRDAGPFGRHQDLKPSYSFNCGQAQRRPPSTVTILEDGIPKTVKNEYRPPKAVNPELLPVTEPMDVGYWNGRFSSAMDRMAEQNPLLPYNRKRGMIMGLLIDSCKNQDAANSYRVWRALYDKQLRAKGYVDLDELHG